MNGPGRSDPCPCGSGRKVKRCCGATVEPLARTDHDRAIAYDVLEDAAYSRRFAADLEFATRRITEGDPGEPAR